MKRHEPTGRQQLEPTDHIAKGSTDVLDLEPCRDTRNAGWWSDAFGESLRIGMVRSISTGRTERRP